MAFELKLDKMRCLSTEMEGREELSMNSKERTRSMEIWNEKLYETWNADVLPDR
jgi:hypothetical protein